MKSVHYFLFILVLYSIYIRITALFDAKKKCVVLENDILTVLQKIPYYQTLRTEQERNTFYRYTNLFLQNVEIVGKGIEVPNSLKIYIAAQSAMITFGLPKQLHTQLRRIVISPDMMYSRRHKQYMKGFFHPKGVIFFSLPHINKGIEDPEDGENLILHELGHALDVFFFRQKKFRFFFFDIITSWIESAKHIKNCDSESTFFREYGIKNLHEFFSVAIENFFERPRKFREKAPEIYQQMTLLLNQDPLEHKIGVDIISLAHLALNKPLFIEPVNARAMLVLFLILFCLAGFAFVVPEIPIFGFLAVASTYNLHKIFEIFYTKRMSFYQDYISVNRVAFRKKATIIPHKNLLYIAHFKSLSDKNKHLLSFVYYDGAVQQTKDDFVSDEAFIKQVKEYARFRNILFLDKTVQKKRKVRTRVSPFLRNSFPYR